MPHVAVSYAPTPAPARRIIAAIACTLLAVLGLTTATAATANAVPGGPALDAVFLTPVLFDDVNGDGTPDKLDRVRVTAQFDVGDQDVVIDQIDFAGNTWFPGLAIAAGDGGSIDLNRTVRLAHLTGVGTGPSLGDGVVWYTIAGTQYSLTIAEPPVLYYAPDPLSVVTTADVVENGGAADGNVVEGDTVGYSTTITNTSGMPLTLTRLPGYDDFPGSYDFAVDEVVTFHRYPETVTYADMVAGGIAPADVSLRWVAGDFADTITLSFDIVSAEAINASAAASAAFTVHSGVDGSNVRLGDAEPGDVIDIKFAGQNLGNVTLDYISLQVGAWSPGITDYTLTNSNLASGAVLPDGAWQGRELRSANGGVFSAYEITVGDLINGYVDLDAWAAFAPNEAAYIATPADYTHSLNQRVYLKDFTTRANLAVTAELIDTNGDGVGQEGETVHYRVRLKNNANQDLTIDDVQDLVGSDIVGQAAGKFIGSLLVQDDAIVKNWNYAITAADVTRGSIDYGAFVAYTGVIDGAGDSRSEWAPSIPTGVYVAPAATIGTTGSYVDLNLDGHPSIGETLTVNVTVTNTGTYDLTGLAVYDVPGSDATGLLPAFPTTVAAGTSSTRSFTYVLTAADFDRGTFDYAAKMDADGLGLTFGSTTVALTGITFAAYATDLDGAKPGSIDVCTTAGAATDTVVNGTPFVVSPEGCPFGAPATGYRVVLFSDPVVLAVGAFTVSTPPLTAVGAHRVAIYAPDGSLVGWRNITVTDPIVFADDDELALTGADAGRTAWTAGGAAALVLLGAAAVFAASRRRRSAEA